MEKITYSINKNSYYKDYGYKYNPDNLSVTSRPEYGYIEQWVENGSKVLDAGCGDGSLGLILKKNKNCDVYGIEISPEGTKIALAKGIHVINHDMDLGFPFEDKSFDYIIINVTLQMVYRPDLVIKEALRVGKKVIVSFPNFAHWYARLELMCLGRFPRYLLFGYQWYDTRHIHHFSYKDFLQFIKPLGANVIESKYLGISGKTENILSKMFPNLFSKLVIVMLECVSSKT